jgi:NADPH:quinone reductase-like Zn-dependent oxidoreductase
VRSLGADHVIDYAAEDFIEGGERYDLIFDNVADRPAPQYVRAVKPGGTYLSVPFSPTAMALGAWISLTKGKKVAQFSHEPSVPDLVAMKDLIEVGKVVPVVDRTYSLEQVAEAMEYYGGGHARGKVIISVASAP